MTFCIYGLRLTGETEARYIGRTGHPLWSRRRIHMNEAKSQPSPTDFARWLKRNGSQVEIFEIATTESATEALALEREMVRVCLALNHRLFNRWLVPAERRLPLRTRPTSPDPSERAAAA